MADAGNNIVYTFTGGFNGQMSATTQTDGAGHVISSPTYSDPNDPLRP